MNLRRYLKGFIQYVSRTYFNQWIVLGLDVLVATLCSLAAYEVIRYITGSQLTPGGFYRMITVSVLSSIVGFILFSTYQDTIRYSQMKNLWRVACGVLFKVTCMSLAVYFIITGENLFGSQYLSVVLFDGMLTLLSLAGLRVLMIVVYESLLGMMRGTNMRIVILGIDEKSVALKTRLCNSSHYKVVGFFIYKSSENLRRLADLPVYNLSSEEDFEVLVKRKNIQGILFTHYEVMKEENSRLFQYCKRNNVRTLVAPLINEVEGRFQQAIRPIKIEDLLGREEIEIDMQKEVEAFRGKVVLVTGAAGSIGSELCRQLARIEVKKLILFDSAETPLHHMRLELEKVFPHLDFVPVVGDVRVKQRVRMVFDTYRPQVVFHAAAYKHVPLMEENPCEAVLVNVIGTRQVADMAVEYQVEKMIMVSTDKAVNPTNVMGASKRLAEIYVQSLGCAIQEGSVKGLTKFITTRFGNVLGSNGSVIPRFKEQIESGGPVTVTHPDIIRFFMTIPEACRLVLQACTLGNGNEIFVFEMGKPVKIADIAARMIELAGYKPDKDIKIEYTGLRPGEKLYEEVLGSEEDTMLTVNQKIKIAKVRKYDYRSILETFDRFENLSRNVEVVEMVSLMKKMVPEFVSQNSNFEFLDKK